MFGFAMLAILHLYYILQKNELRAYILPPVVLMGLGLLYTVLYAFDRSPTGIGYIEANAVTVFSTMGLWEVCIIMRLIPSNSGYGGFFRACTVPMEIIDRKGEVCYKSTGYEQTDAAQSGGGLPDRSYLTRTFEIKGGHVCWREDVTRFYDVIGQLEKGAKALAASNEKLDAQNRMRLREKKAAERARLYDEALLKTGDRLERMREILHACESTEGGERRTDEEQQDALAMLCVLGAYVKRRSNLVMLSEHEEMLPLSELHFCIRESNEALVLVPVSTVYHNEADDTLLLPASEIMRLYDAFQSAIEAHLQGMEYLRMTLVSGEHEVALSLMYGGSDVRDETLTFSAPYGGRAA